MGLTCRLEDSVEDEVAVKIQGVEVLFLAMGAVLGMMKGVDDTGRPVVLKCERSIRITWRDLGAYLLFSSSYGI